MDTWQIAVKTLQRERDKKRYSRVKMVKKHYIRMTTQLVFIKPNESRYSVREERS